MSEAPTVDPRKIFLAFLIGRLVEIENAIYHEIPPRIHSITMMQGIIDSLDEGSQKSLDEQRKKLETYQSGNPTDKNLEAIYKNISCYLHKTYLAEVRYGPTTKVTGLNRIAEKLPKHEG